MICAAWQSPTRGALSPDPIKLARLVGAERAEVVDLLAELHDARVFSWLIDRAIVDKAAPVWRLPGGAVNPDPIPGALIICRRMYRDYCTSQARRDAGRAGGKASGEARKIVASKPQANPNEQASKTESNRKADGKQNELRNAGQILELMDMTASKIESNAAANLNPSDLRSPISDLRSSINADLVVGTGGGGNRIGSFTKEDCQGGSEFLAGIAATLDHRNERGAAVQYWQDRFADIEARGGLGWLQDRFLHLWHSMHPEAGGGVGPIKNPPAWLNRETNNYRKAKA